MFRAFRFVLALVLSTSAWSTARAAPNPKPEIEMLVKAILALSSKDAAAAHASIVYKAQPQPSSFKDKLHSAAGVAKDFGAIWGVAMSTGGTVCAFFIPSCREYFQGSNSGKKPEDDHRQ